MIVTNVNAKGKSHMFSLKSLKFQKSEKELLSMELYEVFSCLLKEGESTYFKVFCGEKWNESKRRHLPHEIEHSLSSLGNVKIYPMHWLNSDDAGWTLNCFFSKGFSVRIVVSHSFRLGGPGFCSCGAFKIGDDSSREIPFEAYKKYVVETVSLLKKKYQELKESANDDFNAFVESL